MLPMEKEAEAASIAEKRRLAEVQQHELEKAKRILKERERNAAEAVQKQLDADAEAARKRRENVLRMSRGLKGSLEAAGVLKEKLHNAEQRANHEIEILHLHEDEIKQQMLSKKSSSHRRLMEKKRKMKLKRMEKKRAGDGGRVEAVLGDRNRGDVQSRNMPHTFMESAENAENLATG